MSFLPSESPPDDEPSHMSLLPSKHVVLSLRPSESPPDDEPSLKSLRPSEPLMSVIRPSEFPPDDEPDENTRLLSNVSNAPTLATASASSTCIFMILFFVLQSACMFVLTGPLIVVLLLIMLFLFASKEPPVERYANDYRTRTQRYFREYMSVSAIHFFQFVLPKIVSEFFFDTPPGEVSTTAYTAHTDRETFLKGFGMFEDDSFVKLSEAQILNLRDPLERLRRRKKLLVIIVEADSTLVLDKPGDSTSIADWITYFERVVDSPLALRALVNSDAACFFNPSMINKLRVLDTLPSSQVVVVDPPLTPAQIALIRHEATISYVLPDGTVVHAGQEACRGGVVWPAMPDGSALVETAAVLAGLPATERAFYDSNGNLHFISDNSPRRLVLNVFPPLVLMALILSSFGDDDLALHFYKRSMVNLTPEAGDGNFRDRIAYGLVSLKSEYN